MEASAPYTLDPSASLSSLNTFWVPASASYLAYLYTIDGIRQFLRDYRIQSMPLLILGGGSNILFTQDYKGCVAVNHLLGYEQIAEDQEATYLKCYAGENWDDLVTYTVNQGLGGLENLALIPGTVGASPIQNIGAYGVELKDVFEELEALEISSGEIRRFGPADCRFSYRSSIFKQELQGKYIIVSVTFRLSKAPVPETSYKGLKQALSARGITDPGIKDVKEVVTAVRREKLPYPDEVGNAGSFFKNPYLAEPDFQTLQAQFPDVPNFPQPDGRYKVPAAWLIEKAGMKGVHRGRTGTHPDQPLVVVNYGGATGTEIYNMAMEVQGAVEQHFGIHLQPEVRIF
jgi:UDP-N-acetylmuramate dehydrogenase